MDEENGLLQQQQQMQMRGDLEKVALEHDEVIDAMLLLTAHAKSIDGLDSSDFIKTMSRQKSGIELAKSIYIELIKAMTMVNDRLSSNQEEEIMEQLEKMSFDAIKLKIGMMPSIKKVEGKKVAEQPTTYSLAENPLINLLKNKQYHR